MLTDDVPTYLRKAEAALTAERDRVQVCVPHKCHAVRPLLPRLPVMFL